MKSRIGIPAKSILLAALALLALSAATQENAPGQVRRERLLEATLRIMYERRESAEHVTITGHGTAFAVELADYGMPRPRYLLSAAHNIRDSKGRVFGDVKVELRDGARIEWVACSVLRIHPQLDLCLLESSTDLPARASLGARDVTPGQPILLGGSPRGIPPRLFDGVLQHRFNAGSVLSLMRVPFDHGDSGGPVFDPQSGKVVGVAVAGIPDLGGEMNHTVGLYIPLACICTFLEEEFFEKRSGTAPRTELPPRASTSQAPTVAANAKTDPSPRSSAPPAPALVANAKTDLPPRASLPPASTVAATAKTAQPLARPLPQRAPVPPLAASSWPRAEVVDLDPAPQPAAKRPQAQQRGANEPAAPGTGSFP